MKQAAVGFRVHSGWSAVVAVCLEKGAPVVLHRQRAQLVETFTYRFRQPYHTGEKMALAEAREFIAGVREKGRDLAYRGLRDLQVELEARGYQLTRGALLLASGRPLPELEKILSSHALIHTADGELFRECLLHASSRCGLAVVSIRERELLEQAAKALRVKRPSLLRRVTELGRLFGAPWTQDEKFATLAAWLALLPSGKSSIKMSTSVSA
ncbi:MAG TPA: hypothetical protein VKA02_01350 [Candidatus Acidoferrum sp.]|nr:hypothetical protein [Candidatus Acidoferrum sp.]